jgi:hypothetical protein
LFSSLGHVTNTCPSRSNQGKGFIPHENDKSLSNYGYRLITLLAFLDRTRNDPDALKLPLTDHQKRLVDRFAQAIEDDREDMELLHQLFLTFSDPPTEETPIGRWEESLHCFIAASNIRIDGSLVPITQVPNEFAEWAYLIRNSVLYETAKHSNNLLEMDRYIHPFGSVNMRHLICTLRFC